LLIILILFSLGPVAHAFAESAIQCHCFKNRGYNPADRVADEIIGEFYRIKPEEISRLRLSGLNEKAINLVFILAHAGEQQPEVLLEQYRKQGKSWSEIAHNLGFEPTAAGKLIQVYPARQITE